MAIKIEKNIAVPELDENDVEYWEDVLTKMEIGDSFLLEGSGGNFPRKNTRDRIERVASLKNIRLLRRTEQIDNDKNRSPYPFHGVRYWRIEKGG